MAYEQVELASVPFVTFISNKGPKGEAANYSFVLRGYVRHWLGKVWAEFDRVKLPEVAVAAMVVPMATATAPPTCWLVLISPEAIPASAGPTPS